MGVGLLFGVGNRTGIIDEQQGIFVGKGAS